MFSVVIATYNYGQLIQRAIDSVLAQSFRSFEIIVVDDGSTDDTQQSLAQMTSTLRYLYQENSGQSAACNRGIAEASGEYVYILDADDEMLPDALESFATAIENHEEHVSIFYGGYISVTESGREKIRPSCPAPSDPYNRLEAFLKKDITGLKHGAFVFPRSIFPSISYAEEVKQATDIVFIGRALAHYPARDIGKLVLRSHEHAQRVRKQLERVLNASMAAVEAMFDPKFMPDTLMSLKAFYAGTRLRSIARRLYIAGDYKLAFEHYKAAFVISPTLMLQGSSISKMIKSAVIALFSKY